MMLYRLLTPKLVRISGFRRRDVALAMMTMQRISVGPNRANKSEIHLNVGVKVDINGQQVSDECQTGDFEIYVRRQPYAQEHQDFADRIHGMIDEETVLRPLDFAVRQRAVRLSRTS